MSDHGSALEPLTAEQYRQIIAAYSDANAQLTATNYELQARLGAALAAREETPNAE